MIFLLKKDALLEDVRQENEHLRVEVQRIRSDIDVVQSAHDALVKEARVLKVQLDERFLVAANTPPVVAVSKEKENIFLEKISLNSGRIV